MTGLWLLAAPIAASSPLAERADPASPRLPDPALPAPDLPVVGGAPAAAGRWPDAAALYTVGGSFACTGTLIAPTLVLTAGHCGFGLDHVVVGASDHRDGGERVRIAASHVHPDHYTTLDLAVLVLEQPVETVEPRRLALDCLIADHLVDGAEVAIVGYGAHDAWASDWSTELHEAWTSVRDPECLDLGAGCNEDVSPGGELIAGGDGVDSCSGDSGGPLYLTTPMGEVLVGVTSRAALPAPTPCGGGGIYVRADVAAEWIEQATGEVLPRPDCATWNRPPRPRTGTLEVPSGGSGGTVIDPNDPNPEDGHRFTLIAAPEQGSAWVGPDGELLVVAAPGASGEDRLVVRVADDGHPAASGDLTVEIRYVRPSGPISPAGCRTGPSPTGGLAGVLAWLGLVALPRRRR